MWEFYFIRTEETLSCDKVDENKLFTAKIFIVKIQVR